MKKTYKKLQEQQSGLSLVELMVALVIGLVLTAGAIQIFISNKQTYRLESELSRMQETGRFIVDTISKEIRMAGYTGCSSRGNIDINTISNNPPPFDPTGENAILGYEATGGGSWSPTYPTVIENAINDIDGDTSKDIISGTDFVIVQRADECGGTVDEVDVSNANIKVNYPNTCDFQQDQTVIVTNCRAADIFSITNVTSNESSGRQTLAHGSSGNTSNKLSQVYDTDSQTFIFLSNIFFIAPGETGEPALYMAQWNPVDPDNYTVIELADGVVDMQILYGIDNAGGDEYADNYITADNVTNWSDVRSARINLLLQSEDNLTSEPRSYMFNGAEANPGDDRRLRMTFTSTVTLRNRLQ